MQKKSKKYLLSEGLLSLLFLAFTILVKTVDVRPVGPEQSFVGLATVNLAVFEFFGVNMVWYEITDWLGVLAMAIALGFAVLGLVQLIKRKSIRKVDRRILLLGAFYAVVIAFYIFFEEVWTVNYRPVLLVTYLEPSYPSSHTMVVTCIMVTAMLQFHHYLRENKLWLRAGDCVSVLVTAVTAAGRLL